MSESLDNRSHLQPTTRGIVSATFWTAVFFGALGMFLPLWRHELVAFETEDVAYLIVGAVLFISLPVAIASFFGRALWGAAVGIVLFVLFLGWIVFALNAWGGT